MRRVGEVRVILGLAILTAYGSSAGAGEQSHDGSTAPELTAVSRAALIGEATAVWRRAGVHLVWDPGAGARPAGGLRILVIPRPARNPEDDVLGELVGFGEATALAIVSIDRAERLIAEWRSPAMVPASLQEDRVGLVLGRAVAHEIGHYVLETRGHTRAGLMRTAFATSELLDRRSPGFDLDKASRSLLRHRIEQRALPPVMADTRTD
jgi:hypothetical protein